MLLDKWSEVVVGEEIQRHCLDPSRSYVSMETRAREPEVLQPK